MRDRAWTKEGTAVKGYHLAIGPKNNVTHYILPHENAVWTSKIFSLNKDNDFITGFVEVIPETVGQFTGLKDKNGKEIWAGDIIKESYVWHFVESGNDIEQNGNYIGEIVILATKGACIKNPIRTGEKDGKEIDTHKLKQYHRITACRCEVIGDIHANPNLLEAKNGCGYRRI